MSISLDILDLPVGANPDPDEFVQAAMRWHFSSETGSPFWLARARTLDFDPLTEVRSMDDLRHFPNVAPELRSVSVRDLLPQAYGARPNLARVFESGGTTGDAKRVVVTQDWLRILVEAVEKNLDAHGVPRNAIWLGTIPTGPHLVGELFRRTASSHGDLGLLVDLDPRWVRKLITSGRVQEADDYAEHLVDQTENLLRTQPVGVLVTTPPLLERMARRDRLVELVNERVRAIRWGGTQLDPDTRLLLQEEVYPECVLMGNYGSTMMLGVAGERPGLSATDPCIFDLLSPYLTCTVVDPETRRPVDYGDRGQVLVSHVSRSFLMPNNLERDVATRLPGLPGYVGDALADIAPVTAFENEPVIEGVY